MKQTEYNTYTPPARRRLLTTYRHLLPAIAGWLFFVAAFFLLKHLIQPNYIIHCALDDAIPFIKWFFIAYCSWYLYLFCAGLYLGIKAKQEFILQQKYLFLGLGICLFLYLVLPNGIDFRPVITDRDPLSLLIASMFAIDSPTMVIPSMHVFCAVAVHISLARYWGGSRRPLSVLSFLLMAAICASTVFIKQHSVLDVLCGVLLAVLLYFPVYGRKKSHPSGKN